MGRSSKKEFGQGFDFGCASYITFAILAAIGRYLDLYIGRLWSTIISITLAIIYIAIAVLYKVKMKANIDLVRDYYKNHEENYEE